MGLSQGQLSRIERGHSAVTVDQLAGFALIYRCPFAHLVPSRDLTLLRAGIEDPAR